MNQQQNITAQTVLNAVTGYPLGHTWSPQLHGLIYKTMGVNAVMLAFPSQNIETIIHAMRALPIHLLAVTLPHKQAVMSHLDAIDETAKKIGAVNTVISRGGKLHGYNTDVVGIEQALEGTPLKHKNVLVLGAGGAARPICWLLEKMDARIFCHNRTPEKAAALMAEFGGKVLAGGELSRAGIDVIINATPLGMDPHTDESPFPGELIRPHQTVFDLVYNPLETRLIREAKKAGAKTVSGIVMLVSQALAQVELWLGKAPEYRKVAPEFINLLSS